ncbi:MAG: GldG family protein [Deltaproteobacteria bacterium]|nr:MAG: GldG family protein [Deltaproteobacteria bacterium]
MRELAFAGLVTIGFGLGAYYATDELGRFTLANLFAGAALLSVALVGGSRRLRRGLGAPASRRVLLPRLFAIAAALLVAVALERAASWSKVQFDLTAARQFDLSSATRAALAELPAPLTATLYYDEGDPRVRHTRVLLETIAQAGDVRVRERRMDDAVLEVERFDLAASNSIVLELADRFEIVERPTEGSFLEGLLRLEQNASGVLYVARGEGEANFRSTGELGFSGLASALQLQGYRLRDLVLASVDAIPEEASAVLLVAPRRALRPESIDALRAYLEGGGSLVALLEPGPVTGVEALLGEFGFGLSDGLVVDPASGPVAGARPGVNPLVESYADHAVTRGLDATRMALFLTARPVSAVRKPERDDELRDLVFTSPGAWLASNVEAVLRGFAPERREGELERRYPLVSVGRYPRGEVEARIVVFGDSDFASNQYLRALYNMDLMLNAAKWASHRDVEASLLPKPWTPDQRPLTPQQTLEMLYAVGLLLPELLLIGGGVIWLRRRSA